MRLEQLKLSEDHINQMTALKTAGSSWSPRELSPVSHWCFQGKIHFHSGPLSRFKSSQSNLLTKVDNPRCTVKSGGLGRFEFSLAGAAVDRC